MKIDIATYNIRYDFEHDGINQWQYRKDHVFEQIREGNYDVIALQEVLHGPLQTFKELEDYDYFGLGRDDGKEAGEYNPIFYKKDKFKLLDKGVFWLSKTPDTPSSDWNSGCKRMLTYVCLETVQTGKQFVFVSTHLDNASELARVNQAQILLEFKENYAFDMPIIICGDFNAYPDSEPIKLMESKINHVHNLTDNITGPLGTYNDFDHQVDVETLNKIDYIFVSEDIKVDNVCTHIKKHEGKFVSDHFMLTAKVEI